VGPLANGTSFLREIVHSGPKGSALRM
jgi:hypothetical protein